jgi:cytochrome c-type biogenesis protein CcmH/NrfG
LEAFWLLAGVLSTLAALFVLLPWLRTVPRIGPLPSVSWPVLAVAAVVLAGVVGLYVKLGRPELVSRTRSAANGAPAPTAGGAGLMGGAGPAPGGASMGAAGSMDSAIASLQARLAKGGGSADEWELLAKSYEFLGRPADAAKARARQLPALPVTAPGSAAATLPAPAPLTSLPVLTAESSKLLAQASAARRNKKFPAAVAIYSKLAATNQMSADSWADYADTAAALQGNKLAGAPSTYIAHALELDPQHPKALWLLASADEEGGRWNDAIGAWQRLMAVLDPNSSDAKLIAANLQQDLKLASASAPLGAAGAAPATSGPATAASAMSATPGIALTGEVTLADALSGKVAKDATLFIVAKSVDAPGIPVAVYRGMVGAWPVNFTLDDSQAMMPGRNLSSAGRVTVEARISRSGQAMPSSGDLSGTSGIIVPATRQPLKILIDREIP